MSTLVTSRLRMHPFKIDDIEFLHTLFTNQDVRKYLWDDRILERSEIRSVVDTSMQMFHEDKLGYWTLFLKENIACGFCGLRKFNAGIGASGSSPSASVNEVPKVELLYGLLPNFWGKGYAFEASKAMLHYGFNLGLMRIYAGADPPNESSFRVMQNLGMSYAMQVVHEGKIAEYYCIEREEFMKRESESGLQHLSKDLDSPLP